MQRIVGCNVFRVVGMRVRVVGQSFAARRE